MATNEKQNPKPQKKKLTQLPVVRNLAGLWFLFLLLAVLPLGLGITGIGEWKTETHEETIVYPDYREGTARETDVKFNAVSAELLGYTCVTEIGQFTDHYAYMLLTDADGNQGVFYRKETTIYDRILETSAGSYITAEEIEAQIAEINENGKTVYGTTVENEVDQQVPDVIPLMEYRGSADYLKLKAEANANLSQAEAFPTVICLYDDGEVPFTKTVTDSREYVLHPIGVVETVIGGIMVLLSLILMFLNPRCQAEENAEILEKVRAKQDARAATARETAKKAEQAASARKVTQATAEMAAAKKAAEKAAAEKAAADRLTTEQRLAEEKQAAQKRSAQERAEVNAQLIPAWNDGSRLIDALLQSDPAAIQQRLRTADAYDLRTFIWELDDELATAGPDDREILEVVRSFAEKEL